MNIEQQAF